MAELTPLDEKLGEVLGLAQAAQDATKKVGKLAEHDEIAARLERMREEAEETERRTLALVARLERMREEAEETERRTLALVARLEGKKIAIREKGRETKREAAEMMKIYLGADADELDGFEFLTMAEAGELGHWQIVRQMSEKVGDAAARELADWAIPIQQRHEEFVRASSLGLAAEEV